MTVPNYLVIGAPKCGTTSVCDLLGSHPDVFMSDPKEPHYFGRDDPAKTWDWYLSLFRQAGTASAIGEGSTSYTHPDLLPGVAAHVASRLPESRLVYVVRHPVKRLESDWKMRAREGWAAASFHDSVRQQKSLVGQGLYWKNIQPYLELFPRHRLMVVFLEDLTNDPTRELRRLFKHLGVDPDVSHADPETPRNRSADMRKDGRLARTLRGSPVFATLKSRLPSSVLRAGKALLTQEKSELTPDWDPALEAEVIDQFREDSAAFLALAGKPADFWFSGADSP